MKDKTIRIKGATVAALAKWREGFETPDQTLSRVLAAVEQQQSNPTLAALKYAMESCDGSSDAMDFLNYWYTGEFEILRKNWNDIPDEVFIGADTQFVPKEAF